jgi:opacity protein-like surface antigen
MDPRRHRPRGCAGPGSAVPPSDSARETPRDLKFRGSRSDTSTMSSLNAARARHMLLSICTLTACLAVATPVQAQNVGVGGRVAWVKSDSDLDVDSVRFVGGHVRLGSGRVDIEVAMDTRSEEFDLLNQKVTETPIQASLLLRLGRGSFAPYLLGGPGWYRRSVKALDGADDGVSVKSTEFGWHAGGGLEVRPSRRFGIHGDYRYTFLDFSDDDDDENDDGGFVRGLLPGHKGSMWTVGATIYF